MGQIFYFVCTDCKVITDMDKLVFPDQYPYYAPPFLEEHRGHNLKWIGDEGPEQDDEEFSYPEQIFEGCYDWRIKGISPRNIIYKGTLSREEVVKK